MHLSACIKLKVVTVVGAYIYIYIYIYITNTDTIWLKYIHHKMSALCEIKGGLRLNGMVYPQ